MEIWMVGREYLGLAESGGVKNVICALAEEFVRIGHKVTVFMPFYGCTNINQLKNFKKDAYSVQGIKLCGRKETVTYSTGQIDGINFVLIGHDCYSAKNNVYTYNQKDLETYTDCVVGTGYKDNNFMNILFAKAIFSYGNEILLKNAPNSFPNILQCHDACTACIPAIIKNGNKVYNENQATKQDELLNQNNNFFDKTKFIITIHNAGPAYHHEFANVKEAAFFTGLPYDVLDSSRNGARVEPYLIGSQYSSLSTVSPDYAIELLDPQNPNTDGLSRIFHDKKIKIEGITNGIDICKYEPENTKISLLPYAFSPQKGDLEGKYLLRKYFLENVAGKNCPEIKGIKNSGFLDLEGKVYFSFHGRLVQQKGITVLLSAAKFLLSMCPDVRFIINGQGEESLQERCVFLTQEFPGKIIYLNGYEKAISRLCTAAGDFAVLPSEFEPCGLEDFISQIFGTIPVAHATGGLKKILNQKTGFTYSPNDADTLGELLRTLTKQKLNDTHCFDKIIIEAANYVCKNYSWQTVVKEKYLSFYKKLLLQP